LSHPNDPIARIGPNSIIQTFNALSTRFGEDRAKLIFQRAGHEAYIGNLPTAMVDEAEFHALVKAMWEEIGETATSAILKESGQRTAEYLLENRIPGLFQSLVKLLPRQLAMKLLLFAISKNAWTFAGSDAFSFEVGRAMLIRVRVSFPSKPVVTYFYGGTFDRLLRTLIDPAVMVAIQEHTERGEIDCFYNVTFP
jgi:divinyl protochlorophyllide a 8-vinyl-reductase